MKDITEKDVYGQEHDHKPRGKKPFTIPTNTIENKGGNPIKITTNMKHFLTFLQGIGLTFVSIIILTFVAKILWSSVVFVWNLW